MKRIYAFVISANKHLVGLTRATSAPGVLTAENENEAIGKALKGSKFHLPESDGWTDHKVSVFELTNEWLREEGFELRRIDT